ncbi:uncharacterized protein LOC113374757 [Ctenocephalides felis]|uniref:uncharacterized protein LOC113374757 n=1 Tax=Ctenocephalides felis TaxID=7515 RepID=UPI000E6E4229|nr:uncharacterized protein LOC113374757 [Ctenocephalides felis]
MEANTNTNETQVSYYLNQMVNMSEVFGFLTEAATIFARLAETPYLSPDLARQFQRLAFEFRAMSTDSRIFSVKFELSIACGVTPRSASGIVDQMVKVSNVLATLSEATILLSNTVRASAHMQRTSQMPALYQTISAISADLHRDSLHLIEWYQNTQM